MRRLLIIIAITLSGFTTCAQVMEDDSLATIDNKNKPIISTLKIAFLNNLEMSLNMRSAFRNYVLRGGYHDYQGHQFQNEYTALGIYAEIHEKVKINFRNRFNKTTDIQSLDQLGSNIELANIEIEITPDLEVQLGRQDAYFGGFEYSFSGIEILQYNDIQSNALAYVTGVGINYDLSPYHNIGFQVLNSRTQHYADKYGDSVAEDIKEPDWPMELVGNWRGSFFGGKFQTIYSYSLAREVKDKYTHFFTLGHKYQNNRLTIMYDFDYSYEEIDTKGLASNIINGNDYADEERSHEIEDGLIAQDVTYIENWIRAEYQINPKFKVLMTLMTNTTYGKNVKNDHSGRDKLRSSYGVVPSISYKPFKDIDVRFFLTYIGRYYSYSSLALNQLDAANYSKNEIKIGFIAPLRFL